MLKVKVRKHLRKGKNKVSTVRSHMKKKMEHVRSFIKKKRSKYKANTGEPDKATVSKGASKLLLAARRRGGMGSSPKAGNVKGRKGRKGMYR